jgi:hypothetical protein
MPSGGIRKNIHSGPMVDSMDSLAHFAFQTACKGNQYPFTSSFKEYGNLIIRHTIIS